ncbi:MAG TPA: TIM barrel protein [Tepidisphaeraceae bacterium]|nr:TIM barrel protein [Tepidisphaeraceae bacterium]
MASVALSRGIAQGQEFHTKLHKAMIVGPVTEAVLAPLKEAGFEGVESRHICPEAEAAAARAVAEKMGMRIHSVMRGWAEFNSEDRAKADKSMDVTRDAMRAAKAYGADDILLVPCRIGGMPMPEPWEFKIDFDEKTGRLNKVVEGDNSKYDAYIKAHNHTIETSRVAIEKLIPLAEELKVIIAVENVWNNLWVEPEFYKNFVASFNNQWVRSYFDIGNHVKYRQPQDWIHTLGPLIVKLHFKGFLLNPDGHGGKFVHLRDDSINWPAVRQALDDINYNGWGSIEEGGLPLAEFARRFDLIAAGK